MTALATPFRNGAIDEAAFARLCNRQIENGTTALVVCGSTGEAAALSVVEQASLVRLAVAVAKSRVPIIAGCGGCSTDAALAVASAAAKSGAAALLCAPTPYVRPSQDGIFAHMRALSQASGLPLIAYDVPGRTGVAMKDDTIARLFAEGSVMAIKDATADLARPPRLRALCGPGLLQFSGDDATAAAYRAAGGHGCISVTANLTPRQCASMHQAWDEGDLSRFAIIRDRLAPLHDALFAETNPVPLKAALAILGLAADELRLPLLPATDPTREKLKHLLGRIVEPDERTASFPRHALAG